MKASRITVVVLLQSMRHDLLSLLLNEPLDIRRDKHQFVEITIIARRTYEISIL